MKIALVANAHLRSSANQGAARNALEIARALRRAGALELIYCYSADPDMQHQLGTCISILDTGIERRLLSAVQRAGRALAWFPARRLEEEYFDARLAAALPESRADALLFTKPVNAASIRAAVRLGKRTAVLVSTLHPRFNAQMVRAAQDRVAIHGYSVFTDRKRVQRLTSVLANVDIVIAESPFFRENYVAHGIPAEKILLHRAGRPKGVDLQAFRPAARPPAKFQALHLSYMTLIKGIDVLLDAWKLIHEEVDGDLVLVGPMDKAVSRLVRSRRLRRLVVRGSTSTPVDHYRGASVFVSPSLSDAHPNTVFEAMACAVPCIVSDHCGASAYVKHGHTGWVYRYDDPGELATILRSAYRERNALSDMGDHARRYIERYPLSEFSAESVEVALAGFSEMTRLVRDSRRSTRTEGSAPSSAGPG